MPEDVDWSFVLHVNGSDGSVHKVNYKTMVNSKYRFNHNRNGRYSGPKRGSEIAKSRSYGDDSPTNMERHSPTIQNRLTGNLVQSDNTTKSPNTLQRIENDILNIDTNSICDSDTPRSKISKKEALLLEEYRERLMTADKRPFKQGPLILPEGWSLSAKVATVKDSEKDDAIPGESRKMIELGSNGIMLNVITPLQKFTKGGITLVDVLWQRFSDMYQLEMSPKLLSETEEIFIGKREENNQKRKADRVRLQMIRLQVEVFRAPKDALSIPQSITTKDTGEHFINSAVSEIITNSKSKECGPLRLHDVNPACSCIRGNTKIFLLSFFKLMPDIRAMFIVKDPETEEIINNNPAILKGLKQPKDSSVFNQCVLTFTAPPQDPKLLHDEILSKGYELRITAWRPNDGRLSHTSFEFKYFLHGTRGCSIKTQKLISNYPISSEESLEKPSETSKHDDECLMCDLLEFKTEKDHKRNLPYAKPGVQRRADDPESKMKAADDSVPIVQLPDSSMSLLSKDSTPSETLPERTTPTTKSNIPIPIAITGGFSTDSPADLITNKSNSNVSVIGGNSSTHRQLVIGDKTNVIAPINMSLVTSMAPIMPNNRISVSPIVPGTLRWKNKGDSTNSTTYFSSTSNSCGIVRLEKDVPHCQPVNTTENSNKNTSNKEPKMEVKIDVLGDGVLDGKKILTSFNNMKKSEASKQGIKLKRLEDLLKSPTESANAQTNNDEQDKPLNLASHRKGAIDSIQESSEQTKTSATKENCEKRSMFKTVSINNIISSQTTSSLDTRKTTSLNHSSFSLVSSEKPSSSPSKAQIEIPMSQEMRIQNIGSPISSLNIQIRSNDLFQKNVVDAQNPSISKDSAMSLHLNEIQKPLSSLVTNASVPKFDLIHNGSYPKLNEDTSEESSTSQLSDSLGIPGIPIVVLDSLNKSSSNAGFVTRQSIRAKNSSKKRSSPVSTNKEVKNQTLRALNLFTLYLAL